MSGETGRAVWFTGERRIELRAAAVEAPGPGEITVQATRSLISAGTEMLVYRGETTPGDRLPPTSEGTFPFPVKYGYQTVGRVVAVGAPVEGATKFAVGDRVFARYPHQELFTLAAVPTLVTPVPGTVDDTAATFLNLTRVALTGHLDVPVKVGETVVVLGQGIVGLMCARIARLAAGRVIAVDTFESRRRLALEFGADAAVAPAELAATVERLTVGRGADVVFEASGAPAALQSAIEVAADHGEIVAVSLYGAHPVPLRLAPEFHFRRLRITSSQAGDQPRWDWVRRTEAAMALLERFGVDGDPGGGTSRMVGATVPFAEAAVAYDLLDRDPASTLGVVLDYGG